MSPTPCPYPGLRPFLAAEAPWFFGRERQVDELLRRLRSRRFLAVVGSSGCGKSSLVLAGLIPALHGGAMRGHGSSWSIATLRPAGDPVGNLAKALLELRGSEPEEAGRNRAVEVEATLRRSSRGLSNALSQLGLADRQVLVVIDQFEELFRFSQQRSHDGSWQDDAAAFVRMILEAAQHDEKLFLVTTMRTDFLGDCSMFSGLPEVLSEAQYLVPRLTRDELREAVVGPAAVEGVQVAPELVQRALNDAGDDPNHLPLLQHALMRTWFQAHHEGELEELRLEHYRASGTLEHALNSHLNEVFDGLSEQDQTTAIRLFKLLSARGPRGQGVRRPTALREVADVTGAPSSAVANVVEVFRQPGRTFLMPPAQEPLTPNSVIDLSHESIMREWARMRDWITEERESERVYRRIAETAALHQDGKAGYWVNPDLRVARDWQEREQPTNAWAGRYGGGFELAMRFLDESVDAFERARVQRESLEHERARARQLLVEGEAAAAIEKAHKDESLKTRLVAVGVFSVVTSLGGVIWMWSSKLQVEADHRTEVASAKKEQREALSVQHAKFAGIASSVWSTYPLNPIALEETPDKERAALSVAVSADGNKMATAHKDGQVRLWSKGQDGSYRPVRELKLAFKQPQGSAEDVDFDHEGKRIVAVSKQGELFVWSIDGTIELNRTLERVDAHKVSFSPDGRSLLLAVTNRQSNTGYAAWWKFGDKEPQQFEHGGRLYDARFDVKGERFVTACGDRTARIYAAGRTTPPVQVNTSGVALSAAFSPDGQEIVTGTLDGIVRTWPVSGGKATREYTHQQAEKVEVRAVNSVRFDPSGRYLVAAFDDWKARIWRRDGAGPMELAHDNAVYTAVFTPDGKALVTASGDGSLKLWRTDGVLDATFSAWDKLEAFRQASAADSR